MMSSLQPFLPLLCVALFLCVTIQFFLIVNLTRRFAAQTKMLRQFFNGPNDEDLQALLERILAQSQEATSTAQVALTKVQEATIKSSNSLQHFALIRYDAFEDVTGQQSFSVALLDGHDSGAIISAIFARSSSLCFGKSIVNGVPEQPLSDEEQQVLSLALGRKNKAGAEKNGHHKREAVGVS